MRRAHMRLGILTALFALFALSGVLAEPLGSEDIREIHSLRRGETATIRGTVVRYRDYDELLLRDATGRIEVYLGEREFRPGSGDHFPTTSRSPSPTRFTDRTLSIIIAPGKRASHHASGRYCLAVASIIPQSAVGGWVPRPRKLRLAVARMA
jgi:hypothetical protein